MEDNEIEHYHKFSKDDIEHFMDNDIYTPTRTIYMGSCAHYEDGEEAGVDYLMAERMCKALHILDNSDAKAQKGDKPITIIMNNVGGDEYHGMAVYDAIKDCKNRVTIKVYGHAMSMGSIILQAADIRLMSTNSKVMIHYGTFGVHDHSKSSYKWTAEGKRFDKLMESIYLKKMGGKKLTAAELADLLDETPPKGPARLKKVEVDLKIIKEMCNFDTFFDAKMALQLNFIDGIINPNEEE